MNYNDKEELNNWRLITGFLRASVETSFFHVYIYKSMMVTCYICFFWRTFFNMYPSIVLVGKYNLKMLHYLKYILFNHSYFKINLLKYYSYVIICTFRKIFY